jgi:hypothetical protein
MRKKQRKKREWRGKRRKNRRAVVGYAVALQQWSVEVGRASCCSRTSPFRAEGEDRFVVPSLALSNSLLELLSTLLHFSNTALGRAPPPRLSLESSPSSPSVDQQTLPSPALMSSSISVAGTRRPSTALFEPYADLSSCSTRPTVLGEGAPSTQLVLPCGTCPLPVRLFHRLHQLHRLRNSPTTRSRRPPEDSQSSRRADSRFRPSRNERCRFVSAGEHAGDGEEGQGHPLLLRPGV